MASRSQVQPGAPPPPGPAPSRQSLVLGVLGGISAGKSAVARLLAGPEGRVLDADLLAHEVLTSPEVTALVRERFGEGVLDAAGHPDRERLASRVFASEGGAEARRTLEGWIHPRVRARILRELGEARTAGVPRIVLDVPLLLENEAQHGLVRECDALVFVDADEDVRDRRARGTRGWAAGEVLRREAAQLPLDEKRRRADFVVPNNESPEELEQAVGDVLAKITAA